MILSVNRASCTSCQQCRGCQLYCSRGIHCAVFKQCHLNTLLARCLRSSVEAIFHHTRLQVIGASYRPTTHRSPRGTPVSQTPCFQKILRTHVIGSRLISMVKQSKFHSSAADYLDFFVIVLHTIGVSVHALRTRTQAFVVCLVIRRDSQRSRVSSRRFLEIHGFHQFHERLCVYVLRADVCLDLGLQNLGESARSGGIPASRCRIWASPTQLAIPLLAVKTMKGPIDTLRPKSRVIDGIPTTTDAPLT